MECGITRYTVHCSYSQKMKIETRHLKVLKVPSSKLG